MLDESLDKFCILLFKEIPSGLMQFAATESPLKIMKNAFYMTFNPIRDGVQKAPSLTSFSPVTSTNVRI